MSTKLKTIDSPLIITSKIYVFDFSSMVLTWLNGQRLSNCPVIYCLAQCANEITSQLDF